MRKGSIRMLIGLLLCALICAVILPCRSFDVAGSDDYRSDPRTLNGSIGAYNYQTVAIVLYLVSDGGIVQRGGGSRAVSDYYNTYDPDTNRNGIGGGSGKYNGKERAWDYTTGADAFPLAGDIPIYTAYTLEYKKGTGDFYEDSAGEKTFYVVKDINAKFDKLLEIANKNVLGNSYGKVPDMYTRENTVMYANHVKKIYWTKNDGTAGVAKDITYVRTLKEWQKVSADLGLNWNNANSSLDIFFDVRATEISTDGPAYDVYPYVGFVEQQADGTFEQVGSITKKNYRKAGGTAELSFTLPRGYRDDPDCFDYSEAFAVYGDYEQVMDPGWAMENSAARGATIKGYKAGSGGGTYTVSMPNTGHDCSLCLWIILHKPAEKPQATPTPVPSGPALDLNIRFVTGESTNIGTVLTWSVRAGETADIEGALDGLPYGYEQAESGDVVFAFGERITASMTISEARTKCAGISAGSFSYTLSTAGLAQGCVINAYIYVTAVHVSTPTPGATATPTPMPASGRSTVKFYAMEADSPAYSELKLLATARGDGSNVFWDLTSYEIITVDGTPYIMTGNGAVANPLTAAAYVRQSSGEAGYDYARANGGNGTVVCPMCLYFPSGTQGSGEIFYYVETGGVYDTNTISVYIPYTRCQTVTVKSISASDKCTLCD